MSFTYTEIKNEKGEVDCIARSDGWIIPIDKSNSDYQAYLSTLVTESAPTV